MFTVNAVVISLLPGHFANALVNVRVRKSILPFKSFCQDTTVVLH